MADSAGVSQIAERLQTELNGGNETGFKQEFTEDCVLMVPGREPIHGKDGAWSFFQAMVHARNASLSDVTTLKVMAVSDNVAISWGSCVLKDGGSADAKKWLHVNKKAGDQWQICLDMWDTN